MSKPPMISVCMPVYNAEPYIAEATNSILAQTYEDFEFIIVNDGSKDRSLEILAKIARKDSRIRLISRPNTGYAKALNEAMDAATGKYFARMDADDISLPTRFEKQVAYLESHPECVVVGSRILTIDPFGSPLYEPDHKLTHEEIEAQLLNGVGWSIVHPVAMARRDLVEKLGRYRTELEPSEDLDLFLRLAEHGRIANLPDVLLHYRQHATSVNHTRYAEQNRNKLRIITEAYARRGQELPLGWKPPVRDILPVEKEINMWGWMALKKGNLHAARKHAVALLKMCPFSPASWRLAYCAFRGH